jgi:hypothetical protein
MGMDDAPPATPVEDLDASDADMAEAVGDSGDDTSAAEAASVTLPAAVLGDREWNEGDQIVLTIRGKNDDGSVEAVYATEEEADSAPPPPTMAGAMDAMPG